MQQLKNFATAGCNSGVCAKRDGIRINFETDCGSLFAGDR